MTTAERIYNALSQRDMTRWELAKAIGETQMSAVVHAITSATFLYPDIYEYDVKRGNGTKVVIGRLCNYKCKKMQNNVKDN